MLAGQDLACGPACRVQLVEEDSLLVRSNLEDGVGGRVDDPLSGSLMLFPQLLDDLRARRGLVPQHATAGRVHEGVDHIVWEAMEVGGKRLGGDDPHVLPVAGRRVLALRPFHQPARNRRGARLGRAAFERFDVAETERLEARKIEPTDRSRDVAQRVRALVTVLRGVRQLAGADGIEHDDAGPGHRAILGTPVSNALGLIEFAAYVLVIVGLAAGITWAVVRLTPSRKPDGPAQS